MIHADLLVPIPGRAEPALGFVEPAPTPGDVGEEPFAADDKARRSVGELERMPRFGQAAGRLVVDVQGEEQLAEEQPR